MLLTKDSHPKLMAHVSLPLAINEQDYAEFLAEAHRTMKYLSPEMKEAWAAFNAAKHPGIADPDLVTPTRQHGDVQKIPNVFVKLPTVFRVPADYIQIALLLAILGALLWR
jgi:hypothetical protein